MKYINVGYIMRGIDTRQLLLCFRVFRPYSRLVKCKPIVKAMLYGIVTPLTYSYPASRTRRRHPL